MPKLDDPLYAERRAVRDAAVSMADQGLATGSSGNVSLRLSHGFLITASGIPYDRLTSEQIIEIDCTGQRHSGEGGPSSEWRMHAAIYSARPDVAAIVHTHSPYATAAAVALQALPIPHDEGRMLFGDAVPVSRHEPPGTWELAQAVVQALADGRLALVARHGAVAVGPTLGEALAAAIKLEEMAHVGLLAAQFRSAMLELEQGS